MTEAPQPPNPYEKEYSEAGFKDKLTRYAKTAGKEVVEKALWLYYATQEETTPAWAKTTIYGALGYFIMPLDAIPDLSPLIGYSDDLGVLALAIATVAAYINDGVKEKTTKKMKEWFNNEDNSENNTQT